MGTCPNCKRRIKRNGNHFKRKGIWRHKKCPTGITISWESTRRCDVARPMVRLANKGPSIESRSRSCSLTWRGRWSCCPSETMRKLCNESQSLKEDSSKDNIFCKLATLIDIYLDLRKDLSNWIFLNFCFSDCGTILAKKSPWNSSSWIFILYYSLSTAWLLRETWKEGHFYGVFDRGRQQQVHWSLRQ